MCTNPKEQKMEVAWHCLSLPGLFPLLVDADTATPLMARMQSWLQLFDSQAKHRRGAFWNRMRQRCVLSDIYVEKVIAGCREARFQYSALVGQVVYDDFRSIGGTQIIEDSFRELRTAERLSSGWSHRMSNKRKFAQLISSGLEDEVHRYTRVAHQDCVFVCLLKKNRTTTKNNPCQKSDDQRNTNKNNP